MTIHASQGCVSLIERKSRAIVHKLAHRIDTIVTAETILSKVGDVLKHEGAILISVTNCALLRWGCKAGVIAVTRRAIQGSYGIINLMLHQAEISQAVVKFRPGNRPGIKLASLVFRMTAIALVNLFNMGMNANP
jgi:hypothetical protein